jgi:hypothetical protein
MSVFKNQRLENRSAMSGEIAYSRTPGGELFDAELYDTCRQGMGFVSHFPYLRGTEIFLKSMNDKEKIVQKATVTWSRPLGHFKKLNPKYRVGVKFHH